jgi:hypothetical protein
MRAVVLSLVLVITGLPRGIEAKEHTAACLVLPSLLERLRGALVLASFHRARGSSLAAYEALRTGASGVARDGGGCGVVPSLLGRSLTRAAGEDSALAASLRLDLGIAAALSVALTGAISDEDAAIKLLDVAESVEYGEGCPDLFRIIGRLGRGDDAGLAGRTSEVTAELKTSGKCRAVSKLLAAAGSNRERINHALDSLRLDEPDSASDQENTVARCPELPMVLERLSSTINVGAPLYNKGDHAGCRDLYRKTARALRDELIPSGRCPAVRAELDSALTAAASASSPDEAAWALRHGFDHITEKSQDGSR